jgi:hypothetical protein
MPRVLIACGLLILIWLLFHSPFTPLHWPWFCASVALVGLGVDGGVRFR